MRKFNERLSHPVKVPEEADNQVFGLL